jgi:hypothetical protein
VAHRRYRIPKETHGSQAWLNQRYQDENGNRRISASAAAAIYGEHPFVPADRYAAELLSGIAPVPTEPTWAMQRGNYLEPAVMQMASDRLNIPFDTPEELFCYDTDTGARLISTLDGWHEPTRHVLEIKTTTRDWNGELPFYWRIQGLQQAICADADRVTWAVFDPSMNLHLYEQTITPEEMSDHISACEQWLNAIELGMDPPGITYSYETVSTKYAIVNADKVDLDDKAADLVERLRHVKSEVASYKALEDQLKAELCELIGHADTAVYNGTVLATWKPQSRRFFDTKRFQLENPETAEQYMKTSAIRTLRLKGDK